MGCKNIKGLERAGIIYEKKIIVAVVVVIVILAAIAIISVLAQTPALI